MILQILPPNFQYQTETVTLVNKAEIISFVVIALILGTASLVRLIKNTKPKFFSELKLVFEFMFAVIRKDLKIN